MRHTTGDVATTDALITALDSLMITAGVSAPQVRVALLNRMKGHVEDLEIQIEHEPEAQPGPVVLPAGADNLLRMLERTAREVAALMRLARAQKVAA